MNKTPFTEQEMKSIYFPTSMTIQELFEEQVFRTPNKTALLFEDSQITYKELNEKANQLAHFLRDNYSIKPDEPIGIISERSDRMIIALLAIIKAGGAYLPIDPTNPPDRIKYMVSDSNMKVLLIEEPMFTKFTSDFPGLEIVDIWNEKFYAKKKENPVNINKSSDLVYIIYTSGSTGNPKGVMIEHTNLVAYVNAYLDEFKLDQSDTYLQVTSVSFDVFAEELFPALLTGAKVVITTKRQVWDVELLAKKINEYHASFISCSPTLAKALNDFFIPEHHLTFILGGEIVRYDHFNNLIKNCTIYNAYGPTETTISATWFHVKEPVKNPISIGKAILNYKIYILDSNNNHVVKGTSGELCISGPGLARGYLGNEELTKAKFTDNPTNPGEIIYRTGDLCRFLPDGNIEFIGRIDEQVKIRGYRIELGEIEKTIVQYSDIKDCIVTTTEKEGSKELVAYLISNNHKNIGVKQYSFDLEELIELLKKSLSSYMIPTYFVEMDQFPRTTSDKIDRKNLPSPGKRYVNKGKEFVPPRSNIEKEITQIWKTVLGLHQISIVDNFFDIGGHSLLAFKIVNRVNKLLNVQLPLKDFFENPTIAAMSAFVEKHKNSNEKLAAYKPIIRISRNNPLPLSPGQESLWFINQLTGESPLYNIPMVITMKGRLNVEELSVALNEILTRHEALRTTFQNNEGEPEQVINEFVFQPLITENISKLDKAQVEEKLKTEATKTFDLSKPFLIRWKLLKLAEDEHILLLIFHHIITDGWSINLLYKELEHFYNKSSHKPSISNLPVQYPDYAFWIHNKNKTDFFSNHLDYWGKKLGKNPESTEFVTDIPRPAFQTYHGNAIDKNLGYEMTNALRLFSLQSGKTLFMTLLGALKVLLLKLTNQAVITIGSPSANRTLSETENMMGYFVNSLVMKTDLSDDPTFNEVLNRIQQTTLEAYEHQEVPFEKVVAHVATHRITQRSVLFQIMFVLENPTEDHPHLDDLKTESREIPTGTAKVDLNFIVEEFNYETNLKIEYNTDLYREKTIIRLLDQYTEILSEVMAKSELPISKLEINNSPKILLSQDPFSDKPISKNSIVTFFEEQVERTPENIAVIFNDQQLTYRELNEKVNQLAHFLRNNYFIEPDQPIGIVTERSDRMIIGILAIVKAGGAYLPMDLNNPLERIRFIIEDSKMKVLLTEEPMLIRFKVEFRDIAIVDIWDDNFYSEKKENPKIAIELSSLVYIIYTSGSTGQPKGVMIEHGNLVAFVNAFLYEFKLKQEDTYLQVTSVSFDVFNAELYPTLVSGAKMVITTKSQVLDLELLTEKINKYKVNFISCTPALLGALNEIFVPKTTLTFIGGGDVLKYEHFNNLIKNCTIYNGYGPTEATVFATFYKITEPVKNPISIGKPLLNYKAYIFDTNNELAPEGTEGELCIGGPGLARGYLGMEELTKTKFTDNPANPGEKIYRTGDLCRLQPDGNIEFIGRMDQQVKIRGYRIELGEIENRILQHSRIKECVAVANKSTSNIILVAYYVTENDKNSSPISKEELEKLLSNYLPEYMIPEYFIQLNKIPLNANGKIDRLNLPAPYFPTAGEEEDLMNGLTETEKKIKHIWEEVLNKTSIKASDNFFEIGGHSLLATKIIYKVNTIFGTKLLLSALFQAPTLKDFARQVEETETHDEVGDIIQLRPGIGNPIFLFSGIDGNPFTFTKLANYYKAEQPLYFIQYPAGRSDEIKYNSLEEYVQSLITKIKLIQKDGPYSIVGYSLGGRIAFETAVQLQQSGEKISVFIILSAFPPFFTKHSNPFVNFILEEGDIFFKVNLKSKIQYLRYRISHLFERFFRKISHATEDGKFESVRLFVDVDEDVKNYLGMYNLWRRYSIKSKYYGEMLLIREISFSTDWKYTFYYFDQVYPDYRWGKFVEGNVKLEAVPVTHNLLLEEPYVQEIAKILNNYISETEGK